VADAAGAVPDAELVEWLQEMVLIRRFEEAAEELSLRGKIPAGIHPAIGQEAVAVGVIRALQPSDVVTSTHRSHHHALAKGLTPNGIMAELFGKETGVVGGRGGSMHLADFDKGLWGSNAIVGGGLGIAMGSALGAVQLGLPRVSVGFFGDGGANTGRVWEFVNMATIWKLPLVAICENNLYAVETASASVTGGESVANRAAGFGLPSEQVDGQDVLAVHEAASRAVARARAGEGPSFIELLTYRYKGHNAGEATTYRSDEEVEEWRSSKDPIERFTARLIERGALTQEHFAEINDEAVATVAAAVQFAEESQCSDPSTAGDNVSAWNDWDGSQNR
jgi:TPP-dependent pyruvate/acetoin dehydrogenase alpha subunit